MDDTRQTVLISQDAIEAYSDPQFVLEYHGKIYVTAAVIEYDPEDQDMDDEERSDLAELQRMLSHQRDVSGTVVGEPPEDAMMAGQTDPATKSALAAGQTKSDQ